MTSDPAGFFLHDHPTARRVAATAGAAATVLPVTAIDDTLAEHPAPEVRVARGPVLPIEASRQERRWTSHDRLEIDGLTFTVTPDEARYMDERSSATHFVVAKQPAMVDRMIELVAELKPKRIVELGIFKGGSTAFLAALAQPDRLTAIELSPEPVQPLAQLIEARGLDSTVVPHYGIDQGDAAQLAAVIDADHAGEPLDLVVDDASHLYRETRTSFELLFAKLRPGGRYVIEDWGWAHFPEPVWQAGGGWFHDRPALTNLVVELLMVAGTGSELIAEIIVLRDTVTVTRGPLALDPPLQLVDHYCNRGLPFRPLL
jgi:predicted O-methyltransferase YrrM